MFKQIIKSALILLISFQGFNLNGQADSTLATPYDAIYNHLFFLQHDSYQPAQSALSFDLAIAPDKAQRLAIQLKQILDGRGLFVQMSKVPEDPEYMDSTYQKKQYYLFPESLPQVYVEFKNKRWQYGSETVKAIPDLHRKTYPMGAEYLLKLSKGNTGKTYWGLFTWQYFGIVILLALALLLFLFLRLLLKPILRKIGKMSFQIDLENKKLLKSTTHVFSLLIVFFLLKVFFPVLQLPVKWTLFTKRALEIIITVFLALLLIRVVEYVVNYFKSIAERTESKMDDQLIPILSQLIKLFIVGAAIFQILHLMNVNVAALIAGISIGGLALALAAKDTVNNLIGSMMIFLDKPFQIGDFIEVSGNMGTVMEVGFRTTRIQTKDTSIISIPNGTIANTTLTNKGIRIYRLFEMTLGVTYDTPADVIEVFVEGLKKISLLHPKVNNDEQYIHMSGFADSSLSILYRVYLDTNSYAEELKIKEEISLSILRMANQLGIRFAFPSTTLYVEDFPGQKSLVPNYGEKEEYQKKLEEFINSLQ